MPAENEVTIYAKVGDVHGLALCDRREDHIQLEANYQCGTPSRVRRIEDQTGVRFEHTYKLPAARKAGVAGRTEYNVPVEEEFFNGFKHIARRKLVKTRHTFDSKRVTLTVVKDGIPKVVILPNLVYEVDVYQMQNGQVCEWCKIDVEIDPVLKFLEVHEPGLKNISLKIKVSHLPFKPLTPFLSTDPTQKELLGRIWKSYSRGVFDNG